MRFPSGAKVVHLLRRGIGAISNRPPDPRARSVAESVLTSAEFAIWETMQGRDRRHSLEVLARFDALAPGAQRVARAAALLHDVGKTATSLGWFGRVIATVVGPRTARFDRYMRHEEIGAEMLAGVSDPYTIGLIVSKDDSDPWSVALRRADDI